MTPQLGMAPDGKGRTAFFFVGVFVMALWTLSAFGLMWKTLQLYAAPHFPSALLNLVVRLPPLPPPAPFDNLMPPNQAPRCVFWDPACVSGFTSGTAPTPFLIFPAGVLAFVSDPNDPRFGMSVQSTVVRQVSLLTPSSGVPISGRLRLPIPNGEWLLFAPEDQQISVECAILQPLTDNEHEQPRLRRIQASLAVYANAQDTNVYGTIFGGVILSWIDQAGFVEAHDDMPSVAGLPPPSSGLTSDHLSTWAIWFDSSPAPRRTGTSSLRSRSES